MVIRRACGQSDSTLAHHPSPTHRISWENSTATSVRWTWENWRSTAGHLRQIVLMVKGPARRRRKTPRHLLPATHPRAVAVARTVVQESVISGLAIAMILLFWSVRVHRTGYERLSWPLYCFHPGSVFDPCLFSVMEFLKFMHQWFILSEEEVINQKEAGFIICVRKFGLLA